MSTWARTANGDMYLPPNGQGASAIVYTAGAIVAIKIPSVLQFVLGEWALNTNEGFDWFSVWSQKNPILALLEQKIRAAILAIPLVASIVSLSTAYSLQTRNVQYALAVKLTTGQTVTVP